MIELNGNHILLLEHLAVTGHMQGGFLAAPGLKIYIMEL